MFFYNLKYNLSNVTLALVLTLFTINLSAQVCSSGAIYVSGSGCGCIGGCDLTPLGGPNCGSGTSGNCDAGHQTMSTTFEVPGGCDVRITAEMKNRTSPCTASGADGSSTSGDRLRIRNAAGGTPPWQIGGSNASLFDQMTVTGPATIIIEGAANRSDEIITYTIEDVGSCNCSQILPIELLDFSGEIYDDISNVLKWATLTEVNNDYFTLERSTDAINFETIAVIPGSGNSSTFMNYNFIDVLPNKQIPTYYYRLKQTDFNGKFEYFDMVAISRKKGNQLSAFVYDNQLNIQSEEAFVIQLLDLTGRVVYSNESQENIIDLSFLSKGVYIYRIELPATILSDKIIVQ
ncbi:MAG: T9SS type A sorting domain-containing protein [Flavobacteriales bacterium]|nr:T9SS type A sorting domain-containing protein [Flavobacteriales bacterium]MCW8913368.1 T9SS type A sorting domain-containing protein [Flavobacteriales bacterium]MCW8939734.1 T9SS type A sorting domain-containing protein [Flavobacteriales bacterium]MCW8969445.1 T9SS type A sorting domain-containing protein [Flavobacteriales bacterium]MCW8990209.1 T9SS type A sorting domain-containing protein [Flavobacteriales bacterium]